MSTIYWIIAFALFYCYLGYGLALIILARTKRSHEPCPPTGPLRVSMLIAAHNEAARIAEKLDNALGLVIGEHKLEVVVVSDGSNDTTAEIVRSYEGRGVRLVENIEHIGKNAALNQGLATIDGDIVVFSDANSIFQQNALEHLLMHFGDPMVGGVCGRLKVPEVNRNWMGVGEAAYWSYDHALKLAESRLGGAVSAQGSLYAVRRELLRPLPPAVCDDLVHSIRVIPQGKRLVFEPNAITEEYVSEHMGREVGRRVRSTEQSWRGLLAVSELLNPFRYGFYSIKLLSHKVLRRLTPFLLVAFAVVNVPLVGVHIVYTLSAAGQVIFYSLAACAYIVPASRRSGLLSFSLFFVLGHVAMALGLFKALVGERTERWQPMREN